MDERRNDPLVRALRMLLCAVAAIAFAHVTLTSAFAFDNSGWFWPVPDSLRMSRGFFNGHQAIDIISTRGVNENVVAARAGTVVEVFEGCSMWDGYGKSHAGCNPVAHLTTRDIWGIRYHQDDGGTDVCNFGYGNGVVIDHGDGSWSTYAHMASVSVSVGQHVDGGTLIGTMGSYGNATGRHLHFAIITNPSISSGGYPSGTAVNTNPHGDEYVVNGTWNGTDNIWYSRDYPSPNGHLDVNGLLDGSASGGLGDMGTCDVYVGGALVANDVTDYYAEHPAGTSYRIDDVRAADGYSYDGVESGSLSGTIPSGGIANVVLRFSSCRLDVNGWLDGRESGGLGAYGTFDVYVDGRRIADDVSDLSQRLTKGSSYEIRDVKPGPEYERDGVTYGYAYEGVHSGTLTGTIGSGTRVVSLAFSSYSRVEPSAEWKEMGFLPSNVTPEECDIEYNNTYTTVASGSPGAGWTRVDGTGETRYENSGGVYDSDFELATSDTRVYVGSYYYHFCGASTGVEVEHYNDGRHTDYHVAGDVNAFNVASSFADDLDPRYIAYKITWVSGQWAGGLATCVDDRSPIWYRRYQYQDRAAVTYHTWRRESGWQAAKDPAASSVRCRFRLKDAQAPAIASASVTGVTPTGYTVTCRATDAGGVAKVEFSSWSDSETEGAAVTQEVVPDASGQAYVASVEVPISAHGNGTDVWYHTKVSVRDVAGNVASYTGPEVRAYVPRLVRYPSRRATLPAGLREVGESAFEGSSGIGEAILPDGVEGIGPRAFADCPRLVVAYMPDSVGRVAGDAFEDTDNVVLLCESDNAAASFARGRGIPYLTGGFEV